jgi:hypothetical protein
MSPTTILRRNQEIIAAAVGEETILLNSANWTYVHFNETATRIWECLGESRSVRDLVTTLMAEYEVDESTCQRQVQDFAQEMSGRGFVVVAEE